MAKNDYLDFDINDLPMKFQHTIDSTNYNFYLYYDAIVDNFYIDIYDENEVPLVEGEKITYGMPLFNNIVDPRLPMVQIIPLDDDSNESEVSKLNFPSIIHLEFIENDPNYQQGGGQS